MNRRSIITGLLTLAVMPLASAAAYSSPLPLNWRVIGMKRLRATDTIVTFRLGADSLRAERLHVKTVNQSVWIDSVTVHGPRDASWTHTIAKNLPPGGAYELPRRLTCAKKVSVRLSYLPFEGPPAVLSLRAEQAT